MIFDDFDDFNQLPKQNSQQSKTKYKTSLESIFEDKQEEIKKGNLLDIYDIYQIKINENFVSTLRQNKSKKNKETEDCSVKLAIEKSKKSLISDHFISIEMDKQKNRKEKNKPVESILASKSDFDSDKLSIDEFKGEVSFHKKSSKRSFYNKNQISIQENLDINNIAEFEKKIKGLKAKSLNFPTRTRKMKIKKLKSFNMVSDFVKKKERDRLKSFVSLDEMVKQKENLKADEEICEICYKGFEVNDFIVQLRKCDHVFHKNCMDEFVKEQKENQINCVICRTCLN